MNESVVHSIIRGKYSIAYREWTPDDGKPSDRGYPAAEDGSILLEITDVFTFSGNGPGLQATRLPIHQLPVGLLDRMQIECEQDAIERYERELGLGTPEADKRGFPLSVHHQHPPVDAVGKPFSHYAGPAGP